MTFDWKMVVSMLVCMCKSTSALQNCTIRLVFAREPVADESCL